MYDGSHLPIEENLANVRKVIEMASKTGAAVETEVGRVGRGEDGSESEPVMASLDDCFAMDDLMKVLYCLHILHIVQGHFSDILLLVVGLFSYPEQLLKCVHNQ